MPPYGSLFNYSYSTEQTPEFQLTTKRGVLKLERVPIIGDRKVNLKKKMKARAERRNKK